MNLNFSMTIITQSLYPYPIRNSLKKTSVKLTKKIDQCIAWRIGNIESNLSEILKLTMIYILMKTLLVLRKSHFNEAYIPHNIFHKISPQKNQSTLKWIPKASRKYMAQARKIPFIRSSNNKQRSWSKRQKK